MSSENIQIEMTEEDQAEMLLKQLMHLKSYEKPDAARMIRNKQNIMRELRKAQSEKRKPLLDLLEINIPWFFAEPKYGIVALFIAFIGLQYAGISARNSSISTGIYTSTPEVAIIQSGYSSSSTTNNYSYPDLPSSYPLFDDPSGDSSVVPVGFEYKK